MEPKRIGEVKMIERGNKTFPIADCKFHRKYFPSTICLAPKNLKIILLAIKSFELMDET